MQIDWWTLALQTINFMIVVWLLSRFLYQPIQRVIQDREAADRKAAQSAEEKSKAADEVRKTFEAKQAELSKSLREEETRLHAEMDEERQAIRTAAEKEADALLAETRSKIEKEKKQALDDLQDQIAGLARDLALKAIGEGDTLSCDGLRMSVNAYLDKLAQTDLADLQKDAENSEDGLRVVTAAPLPEPQQSLWRETLEPRFGNSNVIFESDASILGGIELRFPHAILSFSVADRLRRATDALKA